MRVVRTEKGRMRYHYCSKAQGLGCTGSSSSLDTYEQQLLAAFRLPDDWKERVIAEAEQHLAAPNDTEERWHGLEGRLARLKELYIWGNVGHENYQAQRAVTEDELARLAPIHGDDGQLERVTAYVEGLPAA